MIGRDTDRGTCRREVHTYMYMYIYIHVHVGGDVHVDVCACLHSVPRESSSGSEMSESGMRSARAANSF